MLLVRALPSRRGLARFRRGQVRDSHGSIVARSTGYGRTLDNKSSASEGGAWPGQLVNSASLPLLDTLPPRTMLQLSVYLREKSHVIRQLPSPASQIRKRAGSQGSGELRSQHRDRTQGPNTLKQKGQAAPHLSSTIKREPIEFKEREMQ